MTRMAPSFRGWRGSCTPSSKRLRLLRVLDLMLATEGDTKVGAGQSQERGLCRQTENDHHTVHSASRTITELGPLTALFSSVATPRAPWDLRMTSSDDLETLLQRVRLLRHRVDDLHLQR